MMENIEEIFEGQVAYHSEHDPNDPYYREVIISPNDGMYSEGEFVFEIRCDEYRHVCCRTAILHPNISFKDGAVDFEQDDGLLQVVRQLLELLDHPNFVDPVDEVVVWWENHNIDADEIIRDAIAGERVRDYLFPVNPRYRRLHPAEARADDDTQRYLRDGERFHAPDYFGIRKIVPAAETDEDSDEEDN